MVLKKRSYFKFMVKCFDSHLAHLSRKKKLYSNQGSVPISLIRATKVLADA